MFSGTVNFPLSELHKVDPILIGRIILSFVGIAITIPVQCRLLHGDAGTSA